MAEDYSDFETGSCQQLSSSLEFSTIMRAMKIARRNISRKRSSSLLVPEIKVTLISDTDNEESSDDSSLRKTYAFEKVEKALNKTASSNIQDDEQRLYEEVRQKSVSEIGVNIVAQKSKNLQKNRHESKTPPIKQSGHKSRCLYSASSLPIKKEKNSSKENLIFTSRSKSHDEQVKTGTKIMNVNTIKSIGRRGIANKTGKANTLKELHCIQKTGKGNCGEKADFHYHQSKQNRITKGDETCIELNHSTEFSDTCKRDKNRLAINQLSESRKQNINQMCLEKKYSNSFAMNVKEIPEIVLNAENHDKNRLLSPHLHLNRRNSWKGLCENVRGSMKLQKEKVNLLRTSQLENLSRSDSDLHRYFPAIRSDPTTKHNATIGEKIDSLKLIKKRDNVSFKSEKSNTISIQDGSGYNVGKLIVERNMDNLSNLSKRSSTSSKTTNLLPLGSPTENHKFVFPKSVQNHLTPSTESWKMPVNAKVRSNSWSDVRLLSKVFNQINTLYSDVTSPEFPEVKVDDVLKSWHVQQDDINFIRSAVNSQRQCTDFDSASYEQLKQCRYLRNEMKKFP